MYTVAHIHENMVIYIDILEMFHTWPLFNDILARGLLRWCNHYIYTVHIPQIYNNKDYITRSRFMKRNYIYSEHLMIYEINRGVRTRGS
jgi:hypothetical protein